MAKDGSVAPKERINITFKPAIGGAQEEVELPLKLLVLGDFSRREDPRKLEDRKPIGIDKNTLDEVLAKQAVSLTLFKADLAGLRANYLLTSQRTPGPFEMEAWRTFRLPEQL